jgi:uncharacterized membrane protein YfcA
MEWAILMLLGGVVGFIAGLFGIGGGLILVPALSFLLPQLGFATPEQALPMAIATALVSVIFTGMSSARVHIRGQHVEWHMVQKIAFGLAVGAVCGALLTQYLPVKILGIIFGVMEIAIAFHMLLGKSTSQGNLHAGWVNSTLFGWIAGLLSAVIGIGGGTITTPWLVWHHVILPRAIATASVLGIIIAVSGTATHLNSGAIQWWVILALVSTSLLTAPLGAKLTHQLPIATLKRGFSLLLIILGVAMLIKFF